MAIFTLFITGMFAQSTNYWCQPAIRLVFSHIASDRSAVCTGVHTPHTELQLHKEAMGFFFAVKATYANVTAMYQLVMKSSGRAPRISHPCRMNRTDRTTN